MSDTYTITNTSLINSAELPDPFQKLPALAKRLGVEPVTAAHKHGASMVLRMKDGTCYDVFDIVNAVLDRIDGVTDGGSDKDHG